MERRSLGPLKTINLRGGGEKNFVYTYIYKFKRVFSRFWCSGIDTY